jgi:hypothetical protein
VTKRNCRKCRFSVGAPPYANPETETHCENYFMGFVGRGYTPFLVPTHMAEVCPCYKRKECK